MNTQTYDSLYTQESENLTLREALDEHYRVNPTFTRYDEFEREKSQILVRAHDMSHVIFGCDTHLLGEMQVQTWVSYGCIFPFWKKISYARDKEVLKIIANPIGFRRILMFYIEHWRTYLDTRKKAKQMKKKWEYFKEGAYLDMKLSEIREEYSIYL